MERKFDELHDEGLIRRGRVLRAEDVYPCASCRHYQSSGSVTGEGRCDKTGHAVGSDETCHFWTRKGE